MLIIFTRIWQNYQVYNQIQMEHTRFKPNKIQLNLANGHIKTYSFEFNKFIGFESKQNSSDTNPVPVQKNPTNLG